MSEDAELLFGFLRDMLYEPDKAQLNTALLNEDFRKLGQGLLVLDRQLKEHRDFVNALAKGDLSVDPPRNNELVAPLKSLHASLKHLTWQSQQVAAGDYKQRVDFMGHFAAAFNQMVMQLDARQRALQEEIRKSHEKSHALAESNALLTNITAGIPQGIVVLSNRTNEILFMNPEADKLLGFDPEFLGILRSYNNSGEIKNNEISAQINDKKHYYSLTTYAVRWTNENATAFVMDDISEEREQRKELEHFAMYDELTGVRNRYAGMSVLKKWLKEERDFTLCFADLDNLKYVNDKMGHSAGDSYIIKVAQALCSFSRDAIVSRIGGDEYMVLAPGISVLEAEERLARIRKEFMTETIGEQPSYRGSISYGVVRSTPQLEASEMLSIADERMYEFKGKHKHKIYQRKE